MEKTVIKCDKCGKDISDKIYNVSHIKFTLDYWHGGSIGGKEDEEKFELDLCNKCSEELSDLLKNWLNKKK